MEAALTILLIAFIMLVIVNIFIGLYNWRKAHENNDRSYNMALKIHDFQSREVSVLKREQEMEEREKHLDLLYVDLVEKEEKLIDAIEDLNKREESYLKNLVCEANSLIPTTKTTKKKVAKSKLQ